MKPGKRQCVSISRGLLLIALYIVIVNIGNAAPPNQLPLGIRPVGMGESFVAVADDVNAIAWNPAGLVQLRHRTVNTLYADLYGTGLKHSYLSGIWPFTDRHAVGVDWAHLGFDDDELNLSDNRFSLSYGVRLIHQLSVGGNVRYISLDTGLDDESLGTASGVGVDAALYFEPISGLSFGVFGQDLTNTKVKLKFNQKATIANRRFRVGVAYRPTDTTVIALDIDDRFHLGAEKWFAKKLAVRGGIARDFGSFRPLNSDKTVREPMSFALGGSIRQGVFQFDYAYLNVPSLPDTHRFGLTLAFGDTTHLLRGESAQLEDVLVSFYPLYTKASTEVGKLVLRSSHTRVLPIAVSVYIPEYMDTPIAVVDGIMLRAAASGGVSEPFTIPLRLDFNKKIRSLREDVETTAVITVHYHHKWERQAEYTTPLTLRAMGKVAYRERLDPMVAFIAPDDPVVRGFADAAVKVTPELTEPVVIEMHRVSENILTAMQVFEALNAHGLTYTEDTYTPFQSIYGRNTIAPALDDMPQETPFRYIERKGPFKDTHYPRELLSAVDRTGDCDDLSILFAALLEALGIRTQLVDVKSRVFVAFDSGLREDDIRELNLASGLFVEDSGVLWAPVDTTMVGSLFIEAWQKGVAEYATAQNIGILRQSDIRTAWETYPPTYPTTRLPQVPASDTEDMARGMRENLNRFEELMQK